MVKIRYRTLLCFRRHFANYRMFFRPLHVDQPMLTGGLPQSKSFMSTGNFTRISIYLTGSCNSLGLLSLWLCLKSVVICEGCQGSQTGSTRQLLVAQSNAWGIELVKEWARVNGKEQTGGHIGASVPQIRPEFLQLSFARVEACVMRV